jgi:hypothetical protein
VWHCVFFSGADLWVAAEHLSLFEKLEWIVAKSIDGKGGMSMKAAENRGTPRGDTGKLVSTELFGGHLFESRKPAFAAMMDYVTNLPHCDGKPVGFGMLLEAPGAGKSFMLQRVYDTPLAPELDLRSLRLIFNFNYLMNTDDHSAYQLVSRVLFTYFCGYPTVQIDSTLTKISARVDLLFRGDHSSSVLQKVINLLEADFASHRQLDPAAVRTIFFIDEAGQEKLGRVVVFDADGKQRTVIADPTVRRDICRALDARLGFRGAVFTALQKQIPDFAEFTGTKRGLTWFAIEPLPVRDVALLAPFVVATLSKFGDVTERVPHVMIALALTGGHARTAEVMMKCLSSEIPLANSKISHVLSTVRRKLSSRYGRRVKHVQRWFVPSLLGAKFDMGELEHRFPFDAARAAGDVINSATEEIIGVSSAVVPEVSILRLKRLDEPVVSQLFEFVTNTDRLFASKPTAIAFEELIVATLPLKMRLVQHAVADRNTRDSDRLWWPEQFSGALDRVRLFRDEEPVSDQGLPVPLLPYPSQVAELDAGATCAIVDEIAIASVRIYHINESIWADEWTRDTSGSGEFTALARNFRSTNLKWIVNAPIVVYSALSNQAAIDVVLLYKNMNGEARALMMQMKFSGVDASTRFALDPIIAKCKSHIKLSKPLRDFGIMDMSQITVCIMAQAKISAARELAAKCEAQGVGFHVVLLEPEQLREFFGPSLTQLPFFNMAHGAESLWSDTEAALQDVRSREAAEAVEAAETAVALAVD